MKKYLEDAGVEFQFNTEVTNVIFDIKDGKKVAKAIDCKVKGVETGIVLTENDLVFVTNGSCTEGTIYGDQNHAPNGCRLPIGLCNIGTEFFRTAGFLCTEIYTL